MKVYDDNARPLTIGGRVVGAHGAAGVILDIDITDRDVDPGEIAGYLDVCWEDTGEADAVPVDATNVDGEFVCFDVFSFSHLGIQTKAKNEHNLHQRC